MIALVDCNNFFASCERVFQPQLDGVPVVILSNNDGCAIARSNEAKAIGIKMGQPYFEIKSLCLKHNIHVFSSNYTLYGDMSNRVMATLKGFVEKQEVYSIDESFLDLSGFSNLSQYGQKIRKTVKQWTGLPVSVGIGQTKVLAKFANYLAKKHKFLDGVCNLDELGSDRVNKAMQQTAVGEVWGVGYKIATKLALMGIKTVYDLKIANPKQLRSIFSINIERIIYELNNHKCIEIIDVIEPNKQIVSSRSFGQMITTRDDLHSSLVYHTEQISKKLRKQGLYTRQMVVFASSNRFKDDYFSNSINIVLPAAVDSFRFMAPFIENALDVIYKPNVGYKKAGVLVNDLISNNNEQKDLFDRGAMRKPQKFLKF